MNTTSRSPAAPSYTGKTRAGASPESLPDYTDALAAFHRAFARELSAVVRELTAQPPDSILDAACGDGFYLGLFAECLPARSRLVGLDSNAALLALARRNPALQSAACAVQLREGDVEGLANGPAEFDLIWCAQSLFTLPDPVPAVRQMAAALRPGGKIVVLENDSLHQLQLPWPSTLELALRAAEYRWLSENTAHPSKYYVGRRLPRVFAEAGLEPLGFRTQSIDRQAPLDPDLDYFLRDYLQQLRERVTAFLPPTLLEQLAQLIDPGSPSYLLADRWFTMSWQNVLAGGQRRASAR